MSKYLQSKEKKFWKIVLACCCYLLTTHPNGELHERNIKRRKKRTIRKSLNSYLKTQKDSLTICCFFFAVLNGFCSFVYWNTFFWTIIYGTFLCLSACWFNSFLNWRKIIFFKNHLYKKRNKFPVNLIMLINYDQLLF